MTLDGVIATDPINAEAAAWLKAEIPARFGKPVKYPIHGHDHADHRRYLEDPHAAVLAGLREGQTVEDMQNSIALEAYADWGR